MTNNETGIGRRPVQLQVDFFSKTIPLKDEEQTKNKCKNKSCSLTTNEKCRLQGGLFISDCFETNWLTVAISEKQKCSSGQHLDYTDEQQARLLRILLLC